MNALLGRPAMFIPCFLYKKTFQDANEDIRPVRGVIEFVHPKHGWFRIRYQAGNTVQHECFKACDIGTAVTLLGRR